nr:protein sieve element occlusion C [Tanacetum cinerariifolium]
MDFSRNDSFTPQSSSAELSIEQEFIINKTLLTHEVDRHRVDCKILFQAMENVMFFASNTNNAVDAQPWLLNSAVVRMIKDEWVFKEEPLLVVLDSKGSVSNYNAIDMVLIWGALAFPFTDSREKELWEEEHWNVKLMLDGIDHFLTKTVERDQNICICGSSNLEWTKEFKSGIKKLENAGLQVQVIYVGSRNTSENMQTTLSFLNRENSFTPSKIRLFWLRLEKIKDSIVRVGQMQAFANYENFLKQVSQLLDTDDHNNNWAVFGCGSSKDFVKLEGNKIIELFDLFPVWAEKVATYGLVGAIRSAGKEDMNTHVCDHPITVPYDEGLDQGPVVCDKCKRLIKPCVMYKCDGSQ